MAAKKNNDAPRSFQTTFNIRSAANWHEKLKWEHEQLQQIGFHGGADHRYRLINFCITAWSLVDWIYFELPSNERPGTDAEFRKQLRDRSEVMDTCRHIADSCKHAGINQGVNLAIHTEHDELFADVTHGSSSMGATLFCHEIMRYLGREMLRLPRMRI